MCASACGLRAVVEVDWQSPRIFLCLCVVEVSDSINVKHFPSRHFLCYCA